METKTKKTPRGVKSRDASKVHRTAETGENSRAGEHGESLACPNGYFRWRSPLDRAAAALMLLVAAPVTALLILLVRGTSSGPALFRQVRVGRGGRKFMMFKIRTMVHNAESRTGPIWAIQNDPRLTRVGRVLRKLHLDELPQLWNVIRGDMALVGPRPERPEFTHQLAQQIPRYMERLAVAPGITGLAQINLPPDTDLDSVRRKLLLDLEYVRTAGPWLDFRMLLCTALRIIGIRGNAAMYICFVKRDAELPSDLARANAELADGRENERAQSNGSSKRQRTEQGELVGSESSSRRNPK